MTDFVPTQINAGLTNHDECLSIQTDDLRVVFGIEGAKTGIVTMLKTLGGILFYGKMSYTSFINTYNHNWRSHLDYLYNADSLDYNLKKRLAFYLMMCRTALTESWQYPALISRDSDGQLDQATGMSRAFATSIVSHDPEQQYPVLMLERTPTPLSLLDNPLLIDTDQKLHEVLAAKLSINQLQKVLYFKIWNRQNQPYLRLDYVSNGTWHDEQPLQAQMLMDDFIQWRKKFPKPSVKIYTSWPEQIANTGDYWSWEIAGDTQELAQQCESRPGILETAVKHHHNFHKDKSDSTYTLWIIKNRKFDLINFAPWMNLKHNVLLGNNLDFCLYRPSSDFVTSQVSVYSHFQ
jgi:hypothetical protein